MITHKTFHPRKNPEKRLFGIATVLSPVGHLITLCALVFKPWPAVPVEAVWLRMVIALCICCGGILIALFWSKLASYWAEKATGSENFSVVIGVLTFTLGAVNAGALIHALKLL